ncbi:MAG: HAMP domain-containing protein [Elusimicrobia bacterium]|nr:HAMP domain-containing protein [Elusimicrobiota bacterium]
MNPLRSLSAKLSLLTCLLVLSVIGLMARQIVNGIEEGLIGEMKVRAEFFARSSREAIFPKLDPFSLHFHVEEMVKEKAVTYAGVVDKDGVVLSHSDPTRIGDRLADPFSLGALASDRVELQRHRENGGGLVYDLSAPIVVGPRRVGTARIGFNERSLEEALRGPKRKIIAIAAVATVVSALGTILIVGWITRLLPKLAAAAREAGRGNFSVQVEVKSRDEIGTLARAFNEMTVANSLLFRGLQEEKEKLANIFNDTREGLILTDPEGRILLMNPSARALLGRQDRPAGTMAEALSTDYRPKPDLPVILSGRSRITPFELQREAPQLLILSGVADRLGDHNVHAGFLMIFHDATLEKRGESLARNFLSIVSHKLRTPLAIALGNLELLRCDEKNFSPDQRKMLSKIQGEDEKLARLVEKLITFTAVQSPENIVLDRAETAPADLVDAALRGLELGAGVAVAWDAKAAASLPKAKVDAFLVKEAVANLVENAVKFNPAPKKGVAVTVARADGFLKFTVKDDGPGIPGEEQPKLFRKFYQIDADFTGQIPGFGLGLAFVKSVAEAHGGAAGLRSEPGKGSEFFFTVAV